MTRIAIYSHRSRKEERERTIRELQAIGLEPTVVRVQQENPQQRHNRHNAHNALREAYDGNPVLVLEDDVTPADTLPQWLDYLEATESHVTTLYGCVGKFYQGKTREMVEGNGAPRTSRVEWLQGLRGFYGAQALWIPPGEAEAILADKNFTIDEHEPYGPWDHAVRTHLQRRERRMRITIPNLVQHRAPKSVVNRKGAHTSSIYQPNAMPPGQ